MDSMVLDLAVEIEVCHINNMISLGKRDSYIFEIRKYQEISNCYKSFI